MIFAPEDTFAPRPELIVEQIEDECLVVDMNGDAYYGLNPMGLFIWRAAEAGASFIELVEALRGHYEGVPGEQIERDVRAFLREVIEQGLLEVRV